MVAEEIRAGDHVRAIDHPSCGIWANCTGVVYRVDGPNIWVRIDEARSHMITFTAEQLVRGNQLVLSEAA